MPSVKGPKAGKIGEKGRAVWGRSNWKQRGELKPNGPPLPANWQDALLEYLEVDGTFVKACRRAGVSTSTAMRYRAFDPAFDAACLEARLHAAENYEEDIIKQAKETGNPVGYIVRLKQLKPAEYIERHAVHQVNLNLHANLDETAAVELLKAMLAETSAESRAYLATPIPRAMGPAREDNDGAGHVEVEAP